MTTNFYPNRELLAKEVERCVSARKPEVLFSYCRCCIYNIFDESTIVTECFKCGIQQGITKMSTKMSNRDRRTDAPDLEFLGVC